MIPPDSALGVPHGLLRPWAVLALALCAAAGAALAAGPTRGRGRGSTGSLVAIGVAALAVRAGLSLVQDGGLYDVFNAYRIVGDQLRQGGDVFVEPALGLSNYPPVIYWWWAAVSPLAGAHPHLFAAAVRCPFWVVDAAIAPLLTLLLGRGASPGGALLSRRGVPRGALPGRRGATDAAPPDRGSAPDAALPLRAGWIYALCPVAAAVPTLHGQFDPLVLLPLLLAVAVLRERPRLAGGLAGVAIAVKPWPLAVIVPLVASLTPGGRGRAWRLARPVIGFIAALGAPPLAAFAAYGLVHPDHLLAGARRVATYVAHRQGLGSSLLFGDAAPVWQITAMNVLAWLLASAAGLLAVRRGRAPAEAVGLALLVLLAVSPTVSDQYLVWPLPFLLLAGRLGTVALLSIGLLPAVVGLDLWTSQDAGATPPALLLLATASLVAAACLVVARGSAPR